MSENLITREAQHLALTELVTSYNNRKNGTEKTRLSQQVYDYVVKNITNGNLEPATKITERALAGKLDISHVPVREAFEKLEQHGWIDRIPRRGAFVMDFDTERLESSYQLREIIETGAVNIVAQQITSTQLAELRKLTELLESVYETNNAEVFGPADNQFHKLLVHFTGNKRLEDFFESVVLQAGAYFMIFWVGAMKAFVKTGQKPDYVDQMTHTHIYNAIADRDADLAVNLVRNHIRHSYAILSRMIKLHKELASSGIE